MTVTSHNHLSGHMARVAKALLGAPNQSLTPPASSLSKSFGMNQSSLSRGDRTEMADGNSGAGRPPERLDISEGAPPGAHGGLSLRCVMSRGPLKFKETDLRRAVRAVSKEGLRVRSVTVDSSGKITVVPFAPDDPSGEMGVASAAESELDRELRSFKEAHPE